MLALITLAPKAGLPHAIDRALHVLKRHPPYAEAERLLNIAFNALCGGRALDDIEHPVMTSRSSMRHAPAASPTRAVKRSHGSAPVVSVAKS